MQTVDNLAPMQKINLGHQKIRIDKIQKQTSTPMVKSSLIRHTIIFHEARERFGLSISEYCVAAIIRAYEGGKDSRENYGWVFASRKTIGDCLGLAESTVKRAINTLLAKNIIERHQTTKHLRTTNVWIKEIDYLKRSSLMKD